MSAGDRWHPVNLWHELIGYAGIPIDRGHAMRRRAGPMDITTAAAVLSTSLFAYSAWLTSIVFCSAHCDRPLLIAAAIFFPIGVVHGVGVWVGGW
jgi:hypothetical protein